MLPKFPIPPRRSAAPAVGPAAPRPDGAPRAEPGERPPRPLRSLPALVAVSLVAAAATGLMHLPTGARPQVAPVNGVPLPPADIDAATPRAEAENALRSAYSLARYLQRSVQDYSATTPGALGAFPSSLAFVGAGEDSTGPGVVSVLGADPRRLILAARADAGICAFLRDDRGVDRIETVTVGGASACSAGAAPLLGWREILLD